MQGYNRISTIENISVLNKSWGAGMQRKKRLIFIRKISMSTPGSGPLGRAGLGCVTSGTQVVFQIWLCWTTVCRWEQTEQTFWLTREQHWQAHKSEPCPLSSVWELNGCDAKDWSILGREAKESSGNIMENGADRWGHWRVDSWKHFISS